MKAPRPAWSAASCALAGALLLSCSSEQVASSTEALISDQLHNQGTVGFLFLAPLVPAPQPGGTFAPDLEPVVQIDRIDPATGAALARVVTFDSHHRVGGAKVRVNRHREQYLVRWRTDDYDLSPSATYRISVLVDGHRLGFADVDVVRTSRELRNVNTAEYVPLKLDSTLPIKFRIETRAVDRDGDGVLDWRDNCPDVANGPAPTPHGPRHQPPPDCDGDWHECDEDEHDCGGPGGDPGQLDTDDDGVGDACECAAVTCAAPGACQGPGTCAATTGLCSYPALPDGDGDGTCDAADGCPDNPALQAPGECGCLPLEACSPRTVTEDFSSVGCNAALGTSIPAFVTGGEALATITRSAGGNPLSTYLPQSEECELNIGSCTTFTVDATTPILFAIDSVYAMRFDFVRPMESFTVGKLYASSPIAFTFSRGGAVVATHTINRTGVDCNAGSSGSWTPAGGYDQVEISGSVFGITELAATYR